MANTPEAPELTAVKTILDMIDIRREFHASKNPEEIGKFHNRLKHFGTLNRTEGDLFIFRPETQRVLDVFGQDRELIQGYKKYIQEEISPSIPSRGEITTERFLAIKLGISLGEVDQICPFPTEPPTPPATESTTTTPTDATFPEVQPPETGPSSNSLEVEPLTASPAQTFEPGAPMPEVDESIREEIEQRTITLQRWIKSLRIVQREHQITKVPKRLAPPTANSDVGAAWAMGYTAQFCSVTPLSQATREIVEICDENLLRDFVDEIKKITEGGKIRTYSLKRDSFIEYPPKYVEWFISQWQPFLDLVHKFGESGSQNPVEDALKQHEYNIKTLAEMRSAPVPQPSSPPVREPAPPVHTEPTKPRVEPKWN